MKNTEQKIPALRFSEFEEEWEEKKLVEITDKIGDGLHSTPVYSENSGWYFINGNNLLNGEIIIDETTKQVDDIQVSSLVKELNTHTILISINGTIGNLAFYNNEQVILGKSACYINCQPIINKNFIYNTLQTDRIKRFFFSELTGTTIKNLSLGTIRKTAIFLPSLPEQQKIADFLSAVNKRLQLLKDKKENLETYKRGVMQRIFSQELRFTRPDGSAYPDWEEKKLGEVSQIITGKTPNTKDESLWEGNILFITPTDILEDKKYQEKTERTVVLKKNIKVLPIGSVVYTCIASIGKIAITTKESCTNQQINSIVPNKENSNEFIYYSLVYLTPYIKLMPATTTLPIINKTDFSSILISLPSLPEQRQIANFLSAIDIKIEKLSQQIEATEQYKKGLLQQMFV